MAKRDKKTAALPHPLEMIALEVFKTRPSVGVPELARFLGGNALHHLQLAEEVLESLVARKRARKNRETYTLGPPLDDLVEVPACGFRLPTPATFPQVFASAPVPRDQVLTRVVNAVDRYDPSQSFVVAVVPIDRNGVAPPIKAE